MKRIALVAFLLSIAQPACVVGGYSSGGGWSFWPGGIFGIILLAAVIFFLVRRR